MGIGGKEDAAGLEAVPQLREHPGQLLSRNMKERRICKDAVETLVREIQAQEVLMQNLAAGVLSSHFHEILCTIQSNRRMAEISKRDQVPARPTAQVQDRMRA